MDISRESARARDGLGYGVSVDAVVLPDETRAVLALRTPLNNSGPHLGAFVLRPNV